jgi:starch phosphorylase
LIELAHNLQWSWDRRTRGLFEQLDAAAWRDAGHNPVRLLARLPPGRLDLFPADGTLARIAEASDRLRTYLAASAWFPRHHPETAGKTVAYFSAEFGIVESVPFYAGGLGTLAGDHLKSASDLGVPLVGVGLAYRSGSFRQILDREGWQNELYENVDFARLPMTLKRQTDGSPLTVTVPFPGRAVTLQVWRLAVGRAPLYLLDPDVPENAAEDRQIAQELYGGDVEVRLRQEMLLGIGGVRALAALGIRPDAFHINEGHASFLLLERIRQHMKDGGLDFSAARSRTAASTLFTTHTPVPAGFDLFGPDLLGHYLGPFTGEMGIPFEDLLKLGLETRDGGYRVFNMALLALRHSDRRNAVSRLHGHVSRAMWRAEWPDLPQDQVPVGSVTNGVHLKTWVGDEMDRLLEQRLGADWGDRLDPETWSRIDAVPAAELWTARNRARERLLAYVLERLRAQEARHRGSAAPHPAESGLAAGRLTIGFARRFAPYKRATLLLRDRERLKAMLGHAERPVQLLFAGKAHPANQAGKELLAEIVAFSREPAVQGRVAVLEDYDMEVARHLVQGVDVWLNTPRRPQEASGTSGMKAVVNGVLNVSILDGWWDEAYTPERGWAIGGRDVPDDEGSQDHADAEALYRVLEEEVIPVFYRRSEDGIPHDWIRRMKTSLRELSPLFHSHRMVQEYTERYYLPAIRQETAVPE